MKHQIEFVYFDLGNVLVSFDPNIACNNLVEKFGIGNDQSWDAIYGSGAQDQFEHGQLSGEEFAEQVRKVIGIDAARMPTADLLDAVSDMFTPIDSMAEVLSRVRASGFGVGLLSNTCHAHWDWIGRQSYLMNQFSFDVAILSFEEGAMKPDVAIYEAAEERAGVAAKRLLFLDDKLENIDAALARDWHAKQCFGGPEAIQVLQDFEILESDL
jgi:glucose-1-phosphatase